MVDMSSSVPVHFVITALMRKHNVRSANLKRRLHSKIAGIVILTVGIINLGIFLLVGGLLVYILLAVLVALIGLLLIASPQAWALILETLVSWWP